MQTKNSTNTPSLNIQPYTKQKSRMKNARWEQKKNHEPKEWYGFTVI